MLGTANNGGLCVLCYIWAWEDHTFQVPDLGRQLPQPETCPKTIQASVFENPKGTCRERPSPGDFLLAILSPKIEVQL